MINTEIGIKGRFKADVIETEFCRSVAIDALKSIGGFHRFLEINGFEFDGSWRHRRMLDEHESALVDSFISNSIVSNGKEWEKESPVIVTSNGEWKDNLILDQCLDYLGARTVGSFSSILSACALGGGTATPAVSDVALGSEIKRTTNKISSTSSDDNQTRTRTYTNVYDFPAESSPQNYTEVAVSHSWSPGSNISTRALISGGTVSVGVGQQARVSYSISVTLPANYTDTPTTSGDTGSWGSSSGTFAYCTLDSVKAVGDSNLTIATGSTIPSFGSMFPYVWGVANSSSSFLPYSAGTFKSSRRSVWDLTTAVGSSWNSLISGQAGTNSAGRFAFVFDSTKTKDNTHTLTVDWSITYGRA